MKRVPYRYNKNLGKYANSIDIEPGEKIILVVRQHWIVFRLAFLLMFFFPFVLLAGTFFVDILLGSGVVVSLVGQLLVYSSLISFVIGTALFTAKYYQWRRTYYIVTNKRLVLISQHGIFSHDDREASLSMLQDVRAQIDGLQPTMYGYGDVVVQVSSEDSRLVLHRVADPKEIQHVIIREAHLR